MPNKLQPFRSHHIARALRGAAAAGFTNPSIEVRLPTGATIVIAGSGGNKDSQPTKIASSASASGKKKKSPSGGLSMPARGGQTGT
jgi:hypothetical protein